MSFSKAQNAVHYRPMIELAWQEYCHRTHPGDSILSAALYRNTKARKEWYRAELLEEFGIDSSTALHAAKDFASAMAHFERIIGRDFKWQLRAASENRRQFVFKIEQLCRKHELDDDYVRGIALQATKRDALPADLAQLIPADLVKVLNGIRSAIRRINHASDNDLSPRPSASTNPPGLATTYEAANGQPLSAS